jgi:hypothetical protein|tara:strand:- start:86 stop:241 length:156 start_codon:yes stop_codon:yes gene_type:complete
MAHDDERDYRESWAEADQVSDQADGEVSCTFKEAGVVRFCDYHDGRDEDER